MYKHKCVEYIQICTCTHKVVPGKKRVSTQKNRILPLRSGSSSASTEVVHRPRSQSPLHFDIRNM